MSRRKARKSKVLSKEELFIKYQKAKDEIRKYDIEVSAVLEEFDKRLSEAERSLGITDPYTNIDERLEDIEKRLKNA